jgi:hypothetical protein
MKNILKYSVVLLAAMILSSCSDQVTGSLNSTESSELNKTELLVPGELSQEEADGIIFMRQEEKVARDVYTILRQTWDLKIFENIKIAEQKHMDALQKLIIKYNLTDPVINDEVGVFADPAFQQMFDDFVLQGQQSIIEAMLVGQTIEEQDIAALENQLSFIDNQDLIKVYSNLKTASENHLFAFTNYVITAY